MKLTTISTGNFKLDGGAMFGVVPKVMWQTLQPADENNLCSWAMRCLLIEDGERKILIDTGVGNKQDAKFFSHYYLHGTDTLTGSLTANGVTPEDITDVIHTHLHFDHCGGSIIKKDDELTLAFPNAKYWTNPLHWKWAIEPNERERASFLKENILPMQVEDRLHFIEVPEPEMHPTNRIATVDFTENISLRIVHGHTRAMMLPQIKIGNQTLVYMADLIPSVHHIGLPYIMSYDLFPFTTLQEKKCFLQEALEENYWLFFEHDLSVECCNLKMTEKGIRKNQTGLLADLIQG
ncbi:MAG: MBL fold metallo-hydrolase [Chitinophagia bacterium]|jgi:glyoxylase-like metal-dependent hydrolase (beta-lactamase superfamily II)